MTFPHFSVTAPRTRSDVVKWESDPQFTREQVTVLAGAGSDRELKLGTVLGQRTKGTPTVTPDGGNTGNGTLGAVVLKKPVRVGDYAAICVVAAADGGTFAVLDPDGRRMEDAVVGATFVSPDLDFLISDGAADFVVGDKFTIAIPAGDLKVVGIDFAATDGTADAYGVLMDDATAPDGQDVQALSLVREAIVTKGDLIWPGGASQTEIDTATAELKRAGIIARQEA